MTNINFQYYLILLSYKIAVAETGYIEKRLVETEKNS